MSILSRFPYLKKVKKQLNNHNERYEWVRNELSSLPAGSLLLDAGLCMGYHVIAYKEEE